MKKKRQVIGVPAAAADLPSALCFTVCDLFPGGVEVMAGGDFSDHSQQAVASAWERCTVLLLSRFLRFVSLHRDFHGNSATRRRWALFHLHDNCIRSTMTVQDELGGPVGVGLWIVIIWLDRFLCGYLMSQFMIGWKSRGMWEKIIFPYDTLRVEDILLQRQCFI